MNRFKGILHFTAAIVILLAPCYGYCCTSAIVGAKRSQSGATMLWKHRDTGAPHNFIAYHQPTDSTYEYIALHNFADIAGTEAWMGMNRAGLAIMNTASYNLAPDTATIRDREGMIMSMALQRCSSVAQFRRLLASLPRPLGVQANFGVIDAAGGTAFFETNDNGFIEYAVSDTSAVVRTNYSLSGFEEPRYGKARESIATSMLARHRLVSPKLFTDSLSRFIIDSQTMKPVAGTTAIDEGNFIPRYISTASIVIEAVPSADGDGANYIMWTALGYPPCAKVYKVTFDTVPPEVTPMPDGVTPAEREADALKARIYNRKRKGNKRVINLVELRKITSQLCHYQ